MKPTCKDCGTQYPKTSQFNSFGLCIRCGSIRLEVPGTYRESPQDDPEAWRIAGPLVTACQAIEVRIPAAEAAYRWTDRERAEVLDWAKRERAYILGSRLVKRINAPVCVRPFLPAKPATPALGPNACGPLKKIRAALDG